MFFTSELVVLPSVSYFYIVTFLHIYQICIDLHKINKIYIFIIFSWFISIKRDKEGILLSVNSEKLGNNVRNSL